MTNRFALGIDIGGTKIEASVVSSLGEVVATIREPVIKKAPAVRSALLTLINKLKTTQPLAGVGFSIPGSIEPQSGILRNAPNSPEINNTDFFYQLQNEIPLPVKFENDANCLVLSECAFGMAKGCQNVVGIIMGTGFGGGALVDGHLIHGWRGLAPEIGHTPVDINGRRCLCGNKGCVEAYLSGPSILKRYHEAGGCGDITDTKALFEQQNDITAVAILNETKDIFSRVMAAITSMYDPEIIVLGGGLSLQSMYYGCSGAVARHVFGSTTAPKIVKAKFGDASGKLGAASLFF